ncbi:MAG: hypothetical protein MT334_04240 [Candidatus Nitrosopumilus limneticus]|nr:hypothetical protein [Thermoproteota archaeon]MDC4212359.1 hypothetical protein [Candidatus Nitrosopumilus limneticus]HJJ21104.1 hypothetical protein [Nitrosopumilus sp.]MDA0853107.1 hypothetical protein [Thermoproteota archaeon]MDA1123625.1 hypothetical protein [Thermoproteota archaeon]
MGLFAKSKEKCDACNKPFDDIDECRAHMKNVHPATKPCTKCDGLMAWERQNTPAYANLVYICRKCDFIGEMWKYYSK